MKLKSLFVCFFVLAIFPTHNSCAATASSLTQNGISWTFDQPHTFGQFVNGDYWVVGPVTITAQTHAPATGVVDNYVGTMLNPRFSEQQGYCANTLNYSVGLNVSVPYYPQPGDSIVSTTTLSGIGYSGAWLADAAVLTVVSAPPPANSFRPPYTRPTRVASIAADPLLFSANSIRWSMLPSLSKPASTPLLSHSERLVERVWLEHNPGFDLANIHPVNNMQPYGRDAANNVSEVALQLMLNYSQAEKQNLCIRMIQLGIDIYGICLDNGMWIANGGHRSGRKFPLVFAAVMLNDTGMKNVPIMAGSNFRFQEDGQTYYYDDPSLPAFASKTTFAAANGPAGGDIVAIRGVRGWMDKVNGGSGDIALWRILPDPWLAHEHTPVSQWPDDDPAGHDNYDKAESYRHNCTSQAWMGYALALRLIGTETQQTWNHNSFFDYTYRYFFQNVTNARLAYQQRYPSASDPNMISNGSACTQFVQDMWNTYGKNYTPFRIDNATPEPTPISSPQVQLTSQIRIFPNPVTDQMTIRWLEIAVFKASLIIFASNGDQVKTIQQTGVALSQLVCRAAELAKGVYYYVLVLEMGNTQVKIKGKFAKK